MTPSLPLIPFSPSLINAGPGAGAGRGGGGGGGRGGG